MSTQSDPIAIGPTTTEDDLGMFVKSAPDIYDRSSLKGDYMVMIADQTEEDYFRLAPESRFCEFVDGVVYMPSPVRNIHQEILLFLADLLNGYRLERVGGRVRMGPAVLRIRPGRNLEPDVFFVPADAEPTEPDALFNTTASLVIEILSPSNRSHDLQFKAELYREADVPELWFVDGRDRVLIAQRRTDDGYQIERVAQGPCRCAAIPGFWVDASWLWTDPLPNPRRCLEAILAGPPA